MVFESLSGLNVGVLIIIFILSLLFFVLWILTLVYQGKRKQWTWFILTLVLTFVLGIGLFIVILYWIVWLFDKNLRKKKR